MKTLVPPPLLIAERPVLTFESTRDGKIIAKYQGWAENKAALAGQPLRGEVGPRGVEGRIVDRDRKGGRHR
jgi:hypothetical protein